CREEMESFARVAVFRKLLILTLLWPFLLPPGFCVCRLEAFSARASKIAVERVKELKSAAPRCRCCRHRARPARLEVSTTPASLPDHPLPACPAPPAWQVVRATALSAESPTDEACFDTIALSAPIGDTPSPSSASRLLLLFEFAHASSDPRPVLRC